MSDKTTNQVLASLFSFVAHHEVHPNYPTEMKLIADTLDALQDQRAEMFRERCDAIDALLVQGPAVTPAEAMKPYVDMQLVGSHLDADGRLVAEFGFIGRPQSGHRWATFDFINGEVRITETVDPPAPRYRNRRGYTDAPTIAQHHIDQGDDRAERDREQTDWCDL